MRQNSSVAQLVYSTELTTEHVSESFGGIAQMLSPNCNIS